MSLTCSAASGASASGSNWPGCEPWPCARTLRSQGGSCNGIGLASPATLTCGRCPPTCSTSTACRPQTSSAAAFPAKTSAPPGVAAASTGHTAACGGRCCALCANADPVGWWLRTCLACESAAQTGCSAAWKRRATPAGRSWWVLPMPERPIAGNGSSSWPTPRARDWKAGSAGQRFRRRACTLSDAVGGRLNPDWVEWLMGFPPGWTAGTG